MEPLSHDPAIEFFSDQIEFEIKILHHVTITENKLHSACAFTAFYSMNIYSFILSIGTD